MYCKYTVKEQLLDVKVKSVLEPSSPYDQSLIIPAPGLETTT